MGICLGVPRVYGENGRNILSSSCDDGIAAEFRIMTTPIQAKQVYDDLPSNRMQDRALIEENAMLELRVLLDEAIGKEYFTNYLLKNTVSSICWLNLYEQIEEYKNMSYDIQKLYNKACYIYEHYINPYPFLKIECLAPNLLLLMETNHNGSISVSDAKVWTEKRADTAEMERYDQSIFDETRHNVLRKLCEFYIEFKYTRFYVLMENAVKKRYNRVHLKDFVYYKVLGQGAYGMVVLCKKKSTGIYYAMKVQEKEAMYKGCGDEPWRVCAEKNAFACCKHPYIVELKYALHSSRLVMMVTTLGTAGDLSTVLSKAGGKFSNVHVQFYAAELVSVLGYLHGKELIYRDLKPGNVLLQGDGHIQLVDFGTVADVNGKTFAIFSDEQAASPFMSRGNHVDEFMKEVTDDFDEFSITDTRASSVVGTGIYMAPEMLSLCCTSNSSYTSTVDWWSLGATMYRLLTGQPAVSKQLVNAFLKFHDASNYNHLLLALNSIDFRVLEHIPSASEIVSEFLHTNPRKRLGATGVSGIKLHRYFEGVNWELIDTKTVTPPPIPCAVASPIVLDAPEKTLQELIVSCNKREWLQKRDTDMSTIDSYFQNWDYINPAILQLEYEEQTERGRLPSESISV